MNKPAITPKGSPRYREVARILRERIVRGQPAPGQRLPTRSELATEFGLAPSMIQAVVEQLARTGFVETRVPAGTFVAAHPPHLHRFALIQPYAPGDHGTSMYWQALSQAARAIDQDATPRRMVVAEAIDGHADSERYQMLLGDLEQDRLAGLVFSTNPCLLAHSPLIEAPGAPRVALMSQPAWGGIPLIAQDMEAFAQQAVRRLVSLGRRRLAVVAGFADATAQVGGPALDRALADHGLSIPRYWRLAVYPHQPSAARGVAHLLFSGTQGQKPDAVIILDDHLVDVTLAGMIDAGLRAPEDVEVVAIANYPLLAPTLMPVHRLGFDMAQTLETALGILQAQRQGLDVPMATLMPPIFQEQLSPLAPPILPTRSGT